LAASECLLYYELGDGKRKKKKLKTIAQVSKTWDALLINLATVSFLRIIVFADTTLAPVCTHFLNVCAQI
jgi:hypothetical protein